MDVTTCVCRCYSRHVGANDRMPAFRYFDEVTVEGTYSKIFSNPVPDLRDVKCFSVL